MKSAAEKFGDFPRQRNFEEKRELILREAARLFIEKGVQETSMNEIAARFGISKPALYHYARSKDDIIAQILEGASEGNNRMLARISAEKSSGLQRLRLALEEYARGLESELGRCLAIVQPSSFSAETQALRLSTHRILLDGLSHIVEEGVSDGSIRPCNAKVLVLTVLNALNAMSRWHRPSGDLPRDEVVQEIIGYFVTGLAPR